MAWADILTGLQSLYDLEFSLNFFLSFILIWKFEIQFASLEMTWAEFLILWTLAISLSNFEVIKVLFAKAKRIMETDVKSFKLAEKMLSATVDVKMSVTTKDNIF